MEKDPTTTPGISKHYSRYIVRPSLELSDALLLVEVTKKTGETAAQAAARLLRMALRKGEG